MAGNNDFYVSFGSNASAFSGKLKTELAGARAEIAALNADLAKLGQGPAGSALARLLQGTGGGRPAAPPPASAARAATPGAAIDYERMARDAASYNAEMDGMLRRISTIVQGFDHLAGQITTEERRARRSGGSVQGDQTRYKDSTTGKYTTATNPNAVPAGQYAGKKPTGPAGSVTIAGTPKVMVDDAAFKRVVTAVEKSTSATKDVRKSVDKLYDLLEQNARTVPAGTNSDDRRRGGGDKKQGREAGKRGRDQATEVAHVQDPAPVGRQPRDTSVEAVRTERAQGAQTLRAALTQLEAVKSALAQKGAEQSKLDTVEAQIAKVTAEITKLEAPLRRERSAANRSQAAAARAAAPERLPSQARADAARDIALAGDEDALRTRVRNRDLTKSDLQRIAGTFTNQGYETPFNTKTTNDQLIERILGSRKAYDESGGITRQNLTTGPNVAATEVSKGVRKLIKEIVEAAQHTAAEEFSRDIVAENLRTGGTGSATQSRSGQAKPTYYPATGAAFGGRGDDIVAAAEQALRDRQSRISETSLFSARSLLAQRPNFNPYDPELRAGVSGRGDEAKQARAALASLTRAITAIDTELAKTTIGNPAVRAGLDTRTQARAAYQAAQAERDEQLRARSESYHAVSGSAIDALFGGVTGLGTKAGVGANLTRLFPGIRTTRKGELRPLDDSPITPETIGPVQKAFAKYVKAFRDIARLGESGESSPEALEQAQAKAAQQLERFIQAYERASGSTLPTSTVSIGGKDYRSYSLAQQRAAVEADQAAANAAQRQRRKSDQAAAQASSGGGGGTTGGGGGRKGGGGEPPAGEGGSGRGKGDRDILAKMLAELVSIHGVVAQGIQLNVRRGTPAVRRRTSTAESDAAAANAPDRQAKRKTQRESAAEYSTPAGRASFFAGLPDDLAESLVSEDKLDAATKLVTRGFLNQRDAVALIRQELGLTRKQALQFADDLRKRVGDASLASSVQRGGDREAAKAAAQEAILRAHGGYDPALGYGTMSSQQSAADRSGKAAAKKAAKDKAAADAEAARAARDTAAADAKADAAARARARSDAAVSDTMGRVTDAARHEVAELQQLIRGGADATRVAQQQVAAYRALNEALREQGIKGAERNQRISQVFGAAGAPNSASELQDVRRAASLSQGPGASDTRAQAQNDGQQFGSIMGASSGSAFQRAFFGNNGFASRVVNSVGTFLVRNASAGLVFGLTNALQDAIDQGVQTESTFVRVSEALDKTGRSSDGLRTQLQGLSEEYGVALKDVYTTTAGLTGLFDASDVGNKQLIALTRVAVQLQLISGGALNATEAMQSLSSITSAYGEDSAQHIADVATVIQNNLGVNIEETIEGVARLSGQTKQMGIDFEHAATYVAAISKLTNQTGAGAGEQFSRILESFQQGKTQGVVSDALRTVGVDTRGAFSVRDYQGAIDALLGSYGKLSKAEQARVSTQIGGARQAASINALLSQGAKVLDVVTAAQNSNGAANERAAKISEQLAAQLQRARQAFVNFFAVLVRSGVLNAFGVVLEVVLKTLGSVNHVLSELNDIIDKSPFLSVVRQWGTAIAGLAVGFALARKAAASLVAVMNAGALGRALASRAGAAGAAGAAEGEAAAAGGAGAAGTAGNAGLLALLFRRNRSAAFPRINPAEYRLPNPTGFIGPQPVSAYEQRFGAISPVTGAPSTFSQRLYARQASRFTGLSENLAQRSEALRTRGLTNFSGGYPSELGYASNIERTAAQRATGALQIGTSTALGGTSSAASGVSRGFAAMSRSAFVANAALIGIAAAATLMIEGIQSFNQTTDAYKAAYKSAFGGTDPNAPDQRTQTGQAVTQFDAILEKNNQANKGFSGYSRAFVSAVTDPKALGESALKLGTFGLAGPSGELQKQSDRATGYVDEPDYDKLFLKPMVDLWHRLGKANVTKNITDIDNAMKANEKEITDAAKAVDSSNLSSAQKASLLKELETLHGKLQQSGAQYRLAAEGLNSLDSLTQDQLEAVGPMITALAGFGTTVTQQFAPLLAQYIGTLGLDKGSTYSKTLNELAAGVTTKRVAAAPFNQRGDGGVGYGPNNQIGQYDANGQFKQYKGYINASEAANLGKVYGPSYPGRTDSRLGVNQQGQVGHYDASGRFVPYQGYVSPSEAQSLQAQAPITGPGVRTVEKQVPLTQDQKSALAIKTLETALKAQQDQIASLPAGDERNQRIQTAIQLAGQLDSLIQQRLQRQMADAQALIDSDRLAGNYKGAAAAATAAIKAAAAQYKEGEITQAQYQDQAAQIQAQAATDRVTAATNALQVAKAQTRNTIQQAQLELQIANATLSTLQANGGSADAIQQATVQRQTAILALQDAQAEEQLAALSTRLDAQTSPGDAVAKARAQLAIALATQRDAASRFGTDSTQYQQATQQVIDAQRGITSAINDVVEANSNLAIAYATAAGHTVYAAQLQLKAAQQKLQQALKDSGGNANTAEARNAQAAVVSAQAAVRDAQFQSALDTINFNHDMGTLSAQATIAQLQQLLKMKNLTTDERRQVLEQIHQLQQSLVDDLTSSGFNIPSLGNVKLPTPYEVRRSLGVDKLQQTLKDAVNNQDPSGLSLTTPGSSSTNSDLLDAVRAVTAAVTAKGAQQVHVDQRNTFATPTQAMAKAVAQQVIQILNQQNSQQSRATTTTPRNVSTR